MVEDTLKREVVNHQTEMLTVKSTVGAQLTLTPDSGLSQLSVRDGLYCICRIAQCERGHKKNNILEFWLVNGID